MCKGSSENIPLIFRHRPEFHHKDHNSERWVTELIMNSVGIRQIFCVLASLVFCAQLLATTFLFCLRLNHNVSTSVVLTPLVIICYECVFIAGGSHLFGIIVAAKTNVSYLRKSMLQNLPLCLASLLLFTSISKLHLCMTTHVESHLAHVLVCAPWIMFCAVGLIRTMVNRSDHAMVVTVLYFLALMQGINLMCRPSTSYHITFMPSYVLMTIILLYLTYWKDKMARIVQVGIGMTVLGIIMMNNVLSTHDQLAHHAAALLVSFFLCIGGQSLTFVPAVCWIAEQINAACFAYLIT